MRALRRFVSRIAGMFRGNQADAEFAQEIESDLALHIADNLRRGLSPEQARREALLRFGSIAAVKDDHREHRRALTPMVSWRDVQYGLRMVRCEPLFAFSVVCTLALGVGANAAMFGLVDALMLQPPPHVREPGRMVVTSSSNYLKYLDVNERARTFVLAGYTTSSLSLGVGADASLVRVQCATPNLFDVLGVRAPLGRTFAAADDQRGRSRPLILSHGFWTRHFARDPSVLGRPLLVGGREHIVIGVAPERFRGVSPETPDVWLLLAVTPELCTLGGGNLLWSTGSWLRMAGRLAAGATLAQARAEAATFTTVEGRLANGREVRSEITLTPLEDASFGESGSNNRLALWLAGGALAVLLIACANVAGLLGVRAIDRQREIAIRSQLGGTRGRIVAQLLAEHLVLAAACAAAASLVALGLDHVLRGFFPVHEEDGFLTWRVFAVLALASLGAILASGCLPALRATRADATPLWRAGQTQGQPRSHARQVTLVLQVAVALALVVAGNLFARSLQEVRRDLGYDLEGVLAVSTDLRKSITRTPTEMTAVFERLLERASALPQVAAAATSTRGLLGSGSGGSTVTSLRATVDVPQPPPRFNAVPQHVSDGYFSAVGTPILRGREFGPSDAGRSEAVAIVDANLARELWPHEDAIGKCAYSGMANPACIRIIGVSAARRTFLTDRGSTEYFRPATQLAAGEVVPQALFIRMRDNSAAARAAVASALRTALPDLPYLYVQPLESLADQRARAWRLGTWMFGMFGVVAVMLAALGIYSALATTTRRRTTEFGVRMTLGATPRSILTLVLGRGLIIVIAGCVLGGATSLAASGLIRRLLFGITPTDATAFVAAALVVLVAGIAGSVLPAWRAARVNPAVALRHQ